MKDVIVIIISIILIGSTKSVSSDEIKFKAVINSSIINVDDKDELIKYIELSTQIADDAFKLKLTEEMISDAEKRGTVVYIEYPQAKKINSKFFNKDITVKKIYFIMGELDMIVVFDNNNNQNVFVLPENYKLKIEKLLNAWELKIVFIKLLYKKA